MQEMPLEARFGSFSDNYKIGTFNAKTLTELAKKAPAYYLNNIETYVNKRLDLSKNTQYKIKYHALGLVISGSFTYDISRNILDDESLTNTEIAYGVSLGAFTLLFLYIIGHNFYTYHVDPYEAKKIIKKRKNLLEKL